MPNLNTLLDQHVVLAYESVDRIFLNGYVPRLQDPEDLQWFLRRHGDPQDPLPRYEVLGKLTREFVAGIETYAAEHSVPIVQFEKGQRKEDVAAPYLAQAEAEGKERVVMIGVAQEKANVFRPPSRKSRPSGKFSASRQSAYVKHFYVYLWDSDFGPAFIKFCTYAPFAVRVWLNGNHWLIQRLRRSHHLVETIDNGIRWVDSPRALQRLSARFAAAHIQRFFDRWISFLPNPFSPSDRHAGYTYQLSILQLEISRTEVFDRPLHGRQFFEEVIRDQLDLGRPERMQLVFGRRIPRRRGKHETRTRVFSQDVDPSLQISHRNTRCKQYWKCNAALRTETTFNDTYDFRIGRKLENLPKLIALGRDINRRLLALERQSQRATPAVSVFEDLVMPTGERGRRAPGLRFGDPRTVALFGALTDFRFVFGGFYAKHLRPLVEKHLAAAYSMRQMAYDLRRLVRKDLLERLPGTNRYQLTTLGRRLSVFAAKVYQGVFCRGLARLHPGYPAGPLSRAWRSYEDELDRFLRESCVAA